jgi:CubicO group peptidase (beta-lactamase class C family)
MNSIARIAPLAAVAILSLALAPPPDDLDAFIQAQMAQREITGLSLAIIQDGKIDARAYGVTSRGGAPVTTTTLFQAGSISKPVAAVGALRLVDQGALSLREDVNAKLKTWKVPENEFTQTEKVTLHALLSHTAGLTVHGFPGYDVTERMPSTVEVLDGKGNTAAVRVNAVPMSLARYSGGGYTVMQLLVTDVTGKPFHQYMSEAVLGPLGMTNSTYQQPLPADRAALTASGHYADRSAVSGRWHVYPEMAAAGLWTTPTDLAKFALEIQQSLAGKSHKVVSQAMTREQLTDVKRSGYGLGLALSGTGASRTFGHNGRDAGFDAMMVAFAETGQGLVVMINGNDNSGMMTRITNAVARAYHWPPRSSSPVPAATARIAPGIPLGTVTGRYELSNNNMLTLATMGATLFTDVNGLPDEEFVSLGGDRFGSSQRNVSFRIARNATGAVVGLSWNDNGTEREIPRIGPLFASITPASDPNPSLTKSVDAAVRAFEHGGEAVRGLQQLSPGARANLSGPARQLAGVRGVTYLSSEDLTGRRIERHGGAVARVLFYRVEAAQRSRFVLVYVTSDNLITDYDIVEK